MNRNYVAIIIGVISLGLFVAAANFIAPQTDYSHARVSESEYKQIIGSRKEATEDLLNSMKFNDHKVYYAEKNNTWYYSIVDGDNKAYNPSIKLSGDKSVNIAFKDSQTIDKQSISSANKFDFIIYNDSYYSEYQLVATTLPIITIDHKDEILSEDDVEMSFELYDNREKALKRITQTGGKIHIRGKSSASFDKKSYRLNLRNKSPGEHDRNANEPLLGMREDDDWVLYASYRDSEKIRQTLNSQLAKDSSGYGSENRFVEVIDNSEYAGLYTLSTTIDAKTLGFQKDANGNYTDYLFKKWEWGMPGTITNGDKATNFELKTEKVESEKAAWETLYRYLRHTEEEFDYQYTVEHTDIDSAIDYVLLTELSANIDSINGTEYVKNVLYAVKNRKGKQTFTYIPWDFDITWGTSYINISNLSDTSYLIPPSGYLDYSNMTVGRLAAEDKDIRKQISTRYKYLRQNVWTNEYFDSLLDQYQKEVFDSGAFNRDQERWPDGIYSNAELAKIRSYIKKRLEYCDYWFGLRSDEPQPMVEESLEF